MMTNRPAYFDRRLTLSDDAPPILEFFCNPVGLLAINLARCAAAQGDGAGFWREIRTILPEPYSTEAACDLVIYVDNTSPYIERPKRLAA